MRKSKFTDKQIVEILKIIEDELIADWSLAQNGELPFSIEPLK